jgi:energy-coupling factor transporter transmembrane protein EcfT
MAIVASVTGFVIAVFFARGSSHSLMVARLQPLRIFQIIYILMILAIGAALGERVLRRHLFRWVVMFVLLGGTMLFAQLTTFPHSAHIEFPWAAPTNEWEQGFDWIRNHTPENSVIALDANYITDAGEDAQNFRAIAERSAIPDYSKDGGLAAIAPDLTADWIVGEALQQGLDRATDIQRIAILKASSAGWVVLSQGALTEFDCPYRNNSMKVCRVPGV